MNMQADHTNPVGTWQIKITTASQVSTVEGGQLKGQTTEMHINRTNTPSRTKVLETPGGAVETPRSAITR